jgi:hypothetical protein
MPADRESAVKSDESDLPRTRWRAFVMHPPRCHARNAERPALFHQAHRLSSRRSRRSRPTERSGPAIGIRPISRGDRPSADHRAALIVALLLSLGFWAAICVAVTPLVSAWGIVAQWRCANRLATNRTRTSGRDSGHAILSISAMVRSGGHWNKNLSPIIAQRRREPAGSKRRPRHPGSNSISERWSLVSASEKA